MKSLNLQFGDNRQNQREDMFLTNIVEKVQQGKISSISFIDQAQFIDLVTQKQKKKLKLQPIFNKAYALLKDNIVKHQQSQSKIQEVSYEIKTISSTRQLGYRNSFNVQNKSGALLLRKDSNLKEHQTYEFTEKEFQEQFIIDEHPKTKRGSKHLKLQQIIDEKNDRRIKTSREDTSDGEKKLDPILTARNEEQNFNLQKQEYSENSLSQVRIESQQSCALPLGRLQALKTNFTTEISSGNARNQSATFQQLNSKRDSFDQLINEPRKQTDVVLKSIKGNLQNQGYLIQQSNQHHKKPITAQTSTVKTTRAERKPLTQEPKQVKVTPRSQNTRKTQNQKQQLKKKIITSLEKEEERNQKIEKQEQDNNSQNIIKQTQQPQETSFCGNITISQRNTSKQLDHERNQESPQFTRNDTIDDAVITHSIHQQIPYQNKQQIISQKQDQNPLNVSQNSFQSKRYTFDQPDHNSLLPPSSTRALRTTNRDQSPEQRNSISNISDEQQHNSNHLKVSCKRSSKRMKSHNIQGNDIEYNKEDEQRRYSQERIFNSDNRIERSVDDRFQYTVNNLEQTQSSSSFNNLDMENQNQINIQVSKCQTNRERIIEEESFDGSLRHNQEILFSTDDKMHLKIGDNSFLPQSSSRSVAKSVSPHTPAGSINTALHSSSGNGTNQTTTQNMKRKKQQGQQHQQKRPQLSNEQSQTKIQLQKQKSEDSNYEKEYTNESSLEPERQTRLKPKKLQQQKLVPPTAAAIQQQRRKSSAQVSPIDPRKTEQQEKERQKQLEYQKMIDRMKLERDLMEQYKIPEGMPLPEKKLIIESLINELNQQHDQDVQYQVSLYNQRQDQIQNIQKNQDEKIDFRYNIVNSCYQEMDYLCDHKLKLKQKDQDQKIFHLKFQDQVYHQGRRTSEQDDNKIEDDEGSPFKKTNKIVSSYDPVEIENQLKRKFEFVSETQLLQFLKQFESEFDKKVYQCHLDHPTLSDNDGEKGFQKGLLPRTIKRKQTKNISTKIEIGNYQMDSNKMEYLKQKANRIQKMGQFLLLSS